MRLLLLIAFLTFPLWGFCQEKTKEEKAELTESQIRVRNTTRWAAVLPGSGQVINKKYWKAPLVYASLGTSVYFIIDNTDQMNEFKQAWIHTSRGKTPRIRPTDSNGNYYSESDLENGTYLFRRYRDFSYLALAGIYILQIIDANVDAHMRFFDSNDDLSFSITPPYSHSLRSDVWQIGIKFRLK